MDAALLKEQMIRFEEYTRGLRDGFNICAKAVSEHEIKNQIQAKLKEEKPDGNSTP